MLVVCDYRCRNIGKTWSSWAARIPVIAPNWLDHGILNVYKCKRPRTGRTAKNSIFTNVNRSQHVRPRRLSLSPAPGRFRPPMLNLYQCFGWPVVVESVLPDPDRLSALSFRPFAARL